MQATCCGARRTGFQIHFHRGILPKVRLHKQGGKYFASEMIRLL